MQLLCPRSDTVQPTAGHREDRADVEGIVRRRARSRGACWRVAAPWWWPVPDSTSS